MAPSTPSACIPQWQTCIWGASLIQIDGSPVSLITKAQAIFAGLSSKSTPTCTLLFFHPEITPGISNHGLPIMSKSDFSQFTHNWLNNWLDLIEDSLRVQCTPNYNIVESGDVLNYTTCIMKLTRCKLLHLEDWTDWQESEYIQLD